MNPASSPKVLESHLYNNSHYTYFAYLGSDVTPKSGKNEVDVYQQLIEAIEEEIKRIRKNKKPEAQQKAKDLEDKLNAILLKFPKIQKNQIAHIKKAKKTYLDGKAVLDKKTDDINLKKEKYKDPKKENMIGLKYLPSHKKNESPTSEQSTTTQEQSTTTQEQNTTTPEQLKGELNGFIVMCKESKNKILPKDDQACPSLDKLIEKANLLMNLVRSGEERMNSLQILFCNLQLELVTVEKHLLKYVAIYEHKKLTGDKENVLQKCQFLMAELMPILERNTGYEVRRSRAAKRIESIARSHSIFKRDYQYEKPLTFPERMTRETLDEKDAYEDMLKSKRSKFKRLTD